MSIELTASERRRRAVVRSRRFSMGGVLERLFAETFGGLVYPQIWEDPEVDAAAQLVVDRVAHSVETVGAIIALFDGDEAAQFVIIAWSDGLRGAELRAETGLDQSGVDYAAKRIRKKMREKYPEGWIE